MLIIEEIEETFDVYDITVEDNHNFYANDILVHNCQEINLISSPLNHQDDGRIVQRYAHIDKDKFEDFQEWYKENDIFIDGNTFGEKNEKIHKCTKRDDFKLSLNPLSTDTYTTLPVDVELVYGDKPAEIALCTLAASNLGKIKNYKEFERVCRNIVDTLEWVVDKQEYPVFAALKMLKRRSLGIGVTNFAYWMAKKGLSYEDPKALEEIDRLFEHFTYYCLKAGNDVAKEKGKCKWYNKTNFAKGELIIDNYNKNVDELVKRDLECDWETLREDIEKYGMRNSTYNAYMPVESSSVVSNSTNGLEPPRTPIQIKTSKAGAVKMVIPGFSKYKNKYTYAWDMKNNSGLIDVYSVVQKWTDQAISCNQYYDPKKYENGKVPAKEVLAEEILRFTYYGGKQLYYSNCYDNKTDNHEDKLNEKLQGQEIEDDIMDSGCGDACVL